MVREEYADYYDDRADDLERGEHFVQEDNAGYNGNNGCKIRENRCFGYSHAHSSVVQEDERRD